MKRTSKRLRGRRNTNRSGFRGPNITKSIISRTLNDGRRFANEQYVCLDVHGTTTTLTTTVTTGVISFSYPIDLSGVTGLSRYTNAWDECRIIRAEFEIFPVGIASGITVFFFDEQTSTNPTANEAQERDTFKFQNTNSFKNIHRLTWVPRDLGDLNFIPTVGSLAVPLAYFKAYTNNASFVSPAVVTNLWIVKPTFIVEWRGVKST